MSDKTRANLDSALRAHAAEEWDGDLVIDWVIVAGLVSRDGEQNVGVEASRDPMPNYVTVGLLTEGIRVAAPHNQETP